MYTGFIFFILGTNLWLGTYLSFGISVIALTVGLISEFDRGKNTDK